MSPGLFLGLALGISDKSIKKTFYGVFGGFVGGLIFYAMHAIAQIHKISITGAAAFFSLLLFSPIIYIVFVCCSFGIMYKSFYKAIKGIIGGIVALLAVSPFIFLLLIGYGLASAWPASPDAVRSVIITLLGGYLLWGISLTTGIFIGTELGKKESQ